MKHLTLYKFFKFEKFLREFSFSSINSLNILAFYMPVPYKVVPYKRRVYFENK